MAFQEIVANLNIMNKIVHYLAPYQISLQYQKPFFE